ncbi:membrane magnesium transporter 1 [Eurytemora carolleeae]|uniref:membrane magnesium transporter 1 n=1 Tax=Eurytemora carolleeae TaxID=1294199 RepID=UPI000C7864DB|nr:membrane magnesium transporter 1 [Eurytemora carolleeae]|eukprot:XP_023337188.1 membrane magnesium transporter 1-like [Eurytemora affinis]
MSNSFYRGIVFTGLGCLVHAAYSAAEWRQISRYADMQDMLLPIDIGIQTILSLLLTMFGVLYIAGEFKEIRATVELEGKSWENLRNRPSFYTFNHRGRVFSPFYQPPAASKNILDIPERFMS